MAQITSVTSESLQAKIRQLLPSQQGFGEDLQASNVILPVIDLTSTAEGASTPAYLTRAWDYSTGSAKIENTTPTTIINNPGFWQINAIYTAEISDLSTSTPVLANLSITDGTTPKTVWEFYRSNANNEIEAPVVNDFVVFLRAGDSLTGYTRTAAKILAVQYRQIADVNGNITNPTGFTPQ
jgi:hypothetical protein